MTRLILIWITLVFSVLFLLYNPKGEIGFLFSTMVLTPEIWFYYLFEHLIVLILAMVILSMATEYRYAFKIFVIIQIIDTVDYCLTYGEPWPFLPVSWNVVKVFIFSPIVGYEILKKIWKHLAARS